MAKSFSVLTAIPGFGGRYAITPDGRIWSFKTSKWLKQRLDKYGYYRIGLNNKSAAKVYLVHRLVAITYLPNNRTLPVVNHIDNNPTNNHYSNLEWCTQKQNVKHAVDQKRHAVGEKCSRAKLTATQVLEIRSQCDKSTKFLAQKYNISYGAIWYIRSGKVWAHL